MATIARTESISVADPARQAYQILHFGFTVAPILFGLDKFFNLMVDWEKYVATWVVRIIGNAHTFMLGVGIVEIVAGVVVALKPLGSLHRGALAFGDHLQPPHTFGVLRHRATRFWFVARCVGAGRLSERYSRV